MNIHPRRRRIESVLIVLAFVGLALMAAPRSACGQDRGEGIPATVDTTIEAGEAESETPRRRLVKWNEYDGPVSSVRFGFGFLLDYGTYSQDDESKEQVGTLEADVGVRDLRLLLNGRFKTERKITWTLGYMYDGAVDKWVFRQTGLLLDVPELSGQVFIGRTKEGYSLVKVMNGYHPWAMERTMILDFVPILADGIKWMGYFPKQRLHMSLGAFDDALSEPEKFSAYDHQLVTRIAWTPILSDPEGKVLHVGVSGRTGQADGNSLRIRSRPELNLAPYYVDSDNIPASGATAGGIEAYYRAGPWLYGTEYHWQSVDDFKGENPLFHGGNVVAVWLITGETRAYNSPGGYFNAISPTKTVFEGGPGAWEAALNFSYIDEDTESIRGGTLWRLTPMVSWFLSDNLRLEAAYGYGVLDRFDLEGATQFLQFRLQTFL